MSIIRNRLIAEHAGTYDQISGQASTVAGTPSQLIEIREIVFIMGNGQSLNCGKQHIYDKIDENQEQKRMGNRKESLVTLDIKFGDLDETKENFDQDKLEWETSGSDNWLAENGWQTDKQQFRRREDILYNIFMIETENNEHIIYNASTTSSNPEPKYGRLASLDVTLLDEKSGHNVF